MPGPGFTGGGGGYTATPPTWISPPLTQTPSASSAPAAPSVAQQVATVPQGIIPVTFGVVNLADTLTASELYQTIPGSTIQASQVPEALPFRGSIVALALSSNDAKTAGTATFTAYLDDTATGATLAWTTGLTSQVATFLAGEYPFDRDAELDVRVTTDASYTPTTADLKVVCYLAQTQTESGGT